MIVNARDTQFDWFDNPYINPNVYEVDQTWNPQISDQIQLKKCTKHDLEEFMEESNASWYKNAICFEDK